MLVLGIETTCDETACSIVKDGNKILSNIVYSQAELHSPYGGVIPELSSRRHIEVINIVLEKALQEAQITLKDVDLIAVANGPGLLGSLLVGINFAKGLSYGLQKPLISVNHVEAHLYAAFLEKEPPPFPALGVVISGGHTALLKIPELGNYQLLGETQDDAIGEAFDKVANLLGLPYPGGPAIEKIAKLGNPKKFIFPSGKVKGKPFDFSFSGLKTSVLYLTKGQNASKNSPLLIPQSEIKDIAASFQETALNDIVKKTLLALEHTNCQSLLFGGGVSANQRLRDLFAERNLTLPIFWPDKKLSLDNGAMIATCGFFEYKRRKKEDIYEIEAFSRLVWQPHPSDYKLSKS